MSNVEAVAIAPAVISTWAEDDPAGSVTEEMATWGGRPPSSATLTGALNGATRRTTPVMVALPPAGTETVGVKISSENDRTTRADRGGRVIVSSRRSVLVVAVSIKAVGQSVAGEPTV